MSIRLENESFLIEISAQGAEIVKWLDKRHNCDIVWKKDSDIWKFQTPLLFPKVGALTNKQYVVNNVAYPITNHGFARNSEFFVEKQTGNKVVLKLTKNTLSKQMYPFSFELLVSYTLNANSLEMDVTVLNQGNQCMPYEFGYHPAFSISDLEKTKIVFEKAQFHQYAFSKRKALEITSLNTDTLIFSLEDFYKEDTFIYRDFPEKFSLLTDTYGITFETSDFEYMAFWSKNGSFLCVEPWSNLPDVLENEMNWPDRTNVCSLKPNESKTFHLKIVIN